MTKQNWYKYKGYVLLSTLLLAQGMQPIVMATTDDWHYVPTESCQVDTLKAAPTNVPIGVDGDWLTPGTESNKTAQAIFDILTKEYGVSGAFASGVLVYWQILKEKVVLTTRQLNKKTVKIMLIEDMGCFNLQIMHKGKVQEVII